MGRGLLLLSGSKILAGACLLLAAATLLAQQRPLFPGQNQSGAADVTNNDALSLLLDQNNQMRAELQALRALIEEQGFELRRLQRDSRNRYTNMDQRLQALESGEAPVTAIPDADSPAQTAPVESTLPPIAEPIPSAALEPSNSEAAASAAVNPARGRTSTLQPAVLSEQQLYQMAYESAINSNFERSIAEFDQYLSVYPQGRFVANVHYWKGQSYLYLNRFEEARDSYKIILNEYGDSPKLPDAMYGLGQAFQGLGDTSQARNLFNDIKRRYPNTGVANLADSNLQSLD